MMTNVTGVEDIVEVPQTDVYAEPLVVKPVTDTMSALDNMDPVKMIHDIGKFNPTWANTLWYKLNNQPGQVKTIGETNYIVSPRGNWVKQLRTN
jgi:hypothetical protein